MNVNTLYLEQTDSTNRELWRMLDAGQELPEGFALWAGNQTAGRGLGNTSWYSEPHKNLTFSVVLKPHFLPPNKQFLLNKSIAVAIMTTLSETCNRNDFLIKWPNDIYCTNKKIAGTLIENRIMGNTFELCVAGIGININQHKFYDDIPNPTSLALLTARNFDIKNLLERLLEQILYNYLLIKNKHENLINEAYLKHLLGFGKWMHFTRRKKPLYAMITGVNDYGQLILKNENGDLKEFAMKEIEFLL